MSLRIAFSTVACPEWSLSRALRSAAEWGFQGVELRTMGDGEPMAFASEPAHSDPSKVRAAFDDAGVEPAGLATGVRFDAPIFPPVMGWAFRSRDASVRAGMRAIDLAAACGLPSVRVFAFQVPKSPAPGMPGDTRFSALRRICGRLAKVCDHARNRDVSVLIENGGDFASAYDLDEILRRIASPRLGACYDIGAGIAAGDSPKDALALLGQRLWQMRVRDGRVTLSRDAAPRIDACPLGQGDLHAREFVQRFRASGSRAWVVYNWDRAWRHDLMSADLVLPEAARLLTQWCTPSLSQSAAA